MSKTTWYQKSLKELETNDRYREISFKEKFSFSLIGQEGMDLVEPDYFLRPVPF